MCSLVSQYSPHNGGVTAESTTVFCTFLNTANCPELGGKVYSVYSRVQVYIEYNVNSVYTVSSRVQGTQFAFPQLSSCRAESTLHTWPARGGGGFSGRRRLWNVTVSAVGLDRESFPKIFCIRETLNLSTIANSSPKKKRKKGQGNQYHTPGGDYY